MSRIGRTSISIFFVCLLLSSFLLPAAASETRTQIKVACLSREENTSAGLGRREKRQEGSWGGSLGGCYRYGELELSPAGEALGVWREHVPQHNPSPREGAQVFMHKLPPITDGGLPIAAAGKVHFAGKPPPKGMQWMAGWKLGHVLKCRSKGGMGEARGPHSFYVQMAEK